MARKATGQVVEREGKRGRTYALRFRAYGQRQYVTLGTAEEGWTRRKAELELENVLADVRRGIWRPPEPEPVVEQPALEPTFHEFASEWFVAREPELAERTRVDYRWRLSSHLLPYFADRKVSTLTVEDVDRYRAHKVSERERTARARERGETRARPLSNESINKTLVLLAAVLESAVEYGYLSANPARGRRRRLKAVAPARSFLNPEQVEALLRAATAFDAEATRAGDVGRRLPLLATLALAGLRIGETLDLRWRDVNLAGGTLDVADSKTPAGVRRADLTPAMREFLAEFRARTVHGQAGDYVFPTSKGRRESESNVRKRIVEPAVERADAQLLADGRQPMPAGVKPHSLRRTYISILLAAGADVRYVMGQVGPHRSRPDAPDLRPGNRCRPQPRGEVDRLVGAAHWARMGTSGVSDDGRGEAERAAGNQKDPPERVFYRSG